MNESAENEAGLPGADPAKTGDTDPASAPETPAASSGAASGPNDHNDGIFHSDAPRTEPEPPVSLRKAPSKQLPLVMAGFAVLLTLLVVLFAFHHNGEETPSADSQDLGEGIYKPAGLRGHLLVRWDGKLHYQVQIEPIDPTVAAGFNFVLNNPPLPINLTIRLVDSSGFALCQKDVVIPYNPADALPPVAVPAHLPANKAAAARIQQAESARRAQVAQLQAQEDARRHGQDIFYDQRDNDRKIVAIDAQGEIPCSKQAYKHVDYWEITTNFPTLDDQQALMNHNAQQADERARAARRGGAQKNARRPVSGFYIQGDEHITGYDASRELLATSPGRSFFIGRKTDQPIAASWAANFALIHYKCDQHAQCALTHSGTANVIYGRLND